MKIRVLSLISGLIILLGGVGAASAQTTPPKIAARLSPANPAVRRGRTLQGSLLLDIPAHYHVNAHNPVSRFALPTELQVEAPGGLRIGRIIYPKAIVRRFSFAADRLGVYENHTVIRFSIIVPFNQTTGKGEIKARLSYQSCSDEVCFPPLTRDIVVPITIL